MARTGYNYIFQRLLQILVAQRFQLVTAIGDQGVDQKQRGPLIAVGKAMIGRHGLNQGGSLLPDLRIVADIRTSDGGLDKTRIEDTFESASPERAVVGAQRVRQLQPIVSFSDWQAA
jgi:hypothetical protein